MDKTALEEFERQIFSEDETGWLLSDISKCVDKGANFESVRAICLAIEFLGSICMGITAEQEKIIRNQYRFDTFIDRFFKKYRPYKQHLWLVFRNGMTHGFYPSLSGMVSDKAGGEHLKFDGNNRLIINTHALLDDFKSALTNFHQEIQKDALLRSNMITRFTTLGDVSHKEQELLDKERHDIPLNPFNHPVPSIISSASLSPRIASWPSVDGCSGSPKANT